MADGKRTAKDSGRGGARFDWATFGLLCAIYLVVAYLWDTHWVYPLKLIVVFLHEISHGLAALATGGRIVEIQVFQVEFPTAYSCVIQKVWLSAGSTTVAL